MNTETTRPAATDDTDLLVSTAQLAALILLESGAETFRAEETASILCHAAGRSEAEVIALPTGIFITVDRRDGGKVSSVVRIKKRTIHLFRIEQVNALSRDFTAGKLTLSELNERLCRLRGARIYRPLAIAAAAGFSSAMFSLLFEETLGLTVLFDIAVTFLCAFAAQSVCLLPRLKNAYLFSVTFVSSMLLSAIAVAAVHLSGIGNLSCIIIGSITPLLPGISLTNAIRDTVMGDLVSGTTRIVETLLIAIGIACGVGVVLFVYVTHLGGAI